jgi:chromate transporter
VGQHAGDGQGAQRQPAGARGGLELLSERPAETERIGLAAAARVWHGVGWRSFGGPAGQIAELHRVVVDERRWLSEERFLHALNFCMLLPGPEAQQLATYCGWSLHGLRGGLVAGGLFILPGFAVMLVLSAVYCTGGGLPWLEALFAGLQAAVAAVVIQALLRIARRALLRRWSVWVAAAAFVAVAFLRVPYPLLILAAALCGIAAGGAAPQPPAAAEPRAVHAPRTWIVLTTGVCLWLAPLGVLLALGMRQSLFFEQSLFFGQTALITFGGAYAVLSYVADRAVHAFRWMSDAQMMAGLSLAETTPGPLILVLQFVGFVSAYHAPGALPPLAAGALGAALVVWMTFVPSFLLVLLGAPYLERLRRNRRLSQALAGITPAVVGVIGQLSLWFMLRTAFGVVEERELGPLHFSLPVFSSAHWVSIAIALASCLALLRLRISLGRVLAGAALAGLLARLLGLSA